MDCYRLMIGHMKILFIWREKIGIIRSANRASTIVCLNIKTLGKKARWKIRKYALRNFVQIFETLLYKKLFYGYCRPVILTFKWKIWPDKAGEPGINS